MRVGDQDDAGEVQYLKGSDPVKYPGAAQLALTVRNYVEVHGS